MKHILKIERPKKGRRFVISDIHGCFLTLKKLVKKKIKLKRKDQLFLLGDFIDRGPRSKEVIDFILQLISEGYQVFPMRGNHEHNLLETQKKYNPRMFKFFVEILNKNRGFLDSNLRLKTKYQDFFERLPYMYELDNYFLVHAGINLAVDKPMEDFSSMITIRKKSFSGKEFKKLNGKKIIHGHQVTEMSIILEKINNGSEIIPLDNGCVYTKKYRNYDSKKLGRLCALNLDTLELIKQKNIDQKIILTQ